MIIIPAIDLINGACVRLTGGSFGNLKKYFDDPVEAAEKWKQEGADWLHIIDLDGARTGKQQNLNAALEIKQKIDIKIQYGGGIRDYETIQDVLNNGIDKVILGTRAIEDRDFLKKCISGYKNKVIISLDYGINGMVFKNGWQEETAISIFESVKKAEQSGAEEVIATDISRDGTLEGINIEFIKKILKSSGMKFIIAGGIGRIGDVIDLKEIENMGISGVIIGKALYEGENKINLRDAIRIGA
ncbi:MAG: 1-(5-phosphoribosyl)-5-[(5-phosphoribosylamino)methylideneamino]imidazole-4-carboxamide isomerase [Actinomycetota bacterium]|nr:1-(5-phosphoribosyl)-5-[(5-phosphoribosylamino)methylideneamino]imidazole-4-carboxamide isomerase [Actinomycetota bacterium]